MSSTEKPGFFSKLFGRSVSRPTSSSDSEPSSSSNGGVLSSHDEYSNTNGSSPTASKPLRYLSPTAIESSFSRVPTRPVESTTDAARKRPLESPQASSGFANGSFYLSDTAKRFRGSTANTSLISEPVARLEIPRLDTTWSAGMGVVSPTSLSYSPCSSVRSLRSRITRPSSRASVLSSRTAALLGQIEKVSTPAQDARRMPMLRVGLNKERWNSLGPTTTSNPPLHRLSTVPSRYQVMSSFLTPMQKKPYWRDVSRERTDESNEVSQVPSEPSSSAPIITRVENGEKNGIKNQQTRPPAHQLVLKGADGSNVNREKNKFSANEISQDDSADLEALKSVKGLDASQFVFALPTTGFLAKDVKPSFSFNKPVKVTEIIEESESSDESESDEAESSGSDSGSGRDDESDAGLDEGKTKTKTTEKTSDTSSSAENTSKETSNEENKKSSSPGTADNIAAPSFASKAPASSDFPKGAVAFSIPAPSANSSSSAGWNCPTCCVGNKAADLKCACCGETKPGTVAPAASSSNVFGDKAFKPVNAAPSSSANWDCSSCFVGNKATDLKCSCCGEIKPGAVAPPASSSNVFGDKAFKPASTASSSNAFSFGLASGTGSAPSSVTSFGLKPSAENAATKPTTGAFTFGFKSPTESAAPSTTSIPAITVTQPASAAPVAFKPLFGIPSTATTTGTTGTNGGFTFGSKAPATNGDVVKSVATPSIPLFTSTLSVPIATPATTPAPLFGLPPASSIGSSTSSAPPVISSAPLFGSSALSTPQSTPFGASSGGSTLPLFGSSTSTSAAISSSTPLFGSTLSTTAPSIPLFGGAATSLASAPNGSGSAAAPLAFNFGSSSSKAPLFGASTDAKPLFGASKPSDDEGPGAKKAMFGASSSLSTPFALGGQNSGPGAANLFSSSSSGLFGGLTQSASAPSFSLPSAPPAAPPAAPPSTFNFGSQPMGSSTLPTTFNFGSVPAAAPSAATPFMFGSQPSQPAAPSFGMGSFGAAPAAPFPPPDAANPFAFNSSAPSGSRKMIQAKRRLPGKR